MHSHDAVQTSISVANAVYAINKCRGCGIVCQDQVMRIFPWFL